MQHRLTIARGPVRRCAPIIVAVVALATSPLCAAHPIVPGYERFAGLSADAADATAGVPSSATARLLFSELNCAACHAAPAERPLPSSKQAPILDQVGSRVRADFLRAFLANPSAAKPGATMPDVLARHDPALRERQVTALTHFLASTGTPREASVVQSAIRRGERLFHAVGCTACHQADTPHAPSLATSVSLPPLAAKYSVASLMEFLLDPLAVRPSGRMPRLNLSVDEARDIASYLLRDLQVPAGLKFAYYEGDWNKLPDFASLQPKHSGETAAFDVEIDRLDAFAIVFTGRLRIPKDGSYTFFLASDDGSRLWIDGQLVADNDGEHATTEKSAKAALSAGLHDLRVEYFERGGGQELKVEISGGGLRRQPLEHSLVVPDAATPTARFAVDETLAAEGRRWFATLGCAACHTLRLDGQRLESKPETPAPPLGSLALDRGCLAAAVPPTAAAYGIDVRQRASLAEAVRELASPKTAAAPPASGTPADRIQFAMLQFNCYACHDRDGLGGVEPERNTNFQSNQPEMGDEGRLPPPLTGVGAKLTPGWLRQLLDQGAKDRPYMLTRMPRFGLANLPSLVDDLAVADPALPPREWNTRFAARELKTDGRRLVGEQGYSCVKCHTWGEVKASGIQAISLTTMSRRLRDNWFHDYLLDPPRFRPGTRMPAAWPMGQVLLPKVLDGRAETQIHAIWTYLLDGEQAAIPAGIGEQRIVLRAEREPVLYRNFIAGAGTRAIGVGYPEQVNQAFDANDLRLALLWHGDFIDAAMHWQGRGPGFQNPLGDNVLSLPAGVAFARLPDAQAAWPTASAKELGYQFRGYRLDGQRRPTFLYDIGSVRVEDRVEPLPAERFAPVRRVLHVVGVPAGDLYYRAAVAAEITARDGGWYELAGNWRMRLESSAVPIIRSSGGAKELLVPITGALTIVQEYHW